MLANLAHMNPSGRMRYSLSLLTAGAYRMAVEMYRGIPKHTPSRMDNLLPVLWAFDTRDEDTIARIQCAIQWVWDQNSYALTTQVAAWDNEGILCYVFRYLRKREAIYPMVIQKDLENGFS